MQKKLSLMLALLLFIMVPIQAMGAPGDFKDIPENWSTQALKQAVENGLMQGHEGKLFPEKNLSRAEMAAMVNRALNTKTEADLSNYVDVVEGSWQYKEMSKAVGAKIFQGSNNKLKPNDMITREEAFVVLSRLMNTKSSLENKMAFYDLDKISSWARQGINGMLNAGYVQGSNGYINPKAPITRAEFAQLMSNVVQTYIQTPGTHENVKTGNVIVNTPDVTLKDLTITGDLIIGDGVGEGEVTLDNVIVEGRLIARGGGENSIIIKGNSSIETIIILKDGNKIRIFNESGNEIATSTVEGNADVILQGKFKDVVIQSPDISVFAKDTKIEKVEINGEKSKLIVDEKTTINKIEVKAEKVTIEGQGKVEEVEVKKEGSNASITTPNTEIKVDKEAKDIKGTGNVAIKTDETYVNGKTDKEDAKPLKKPSTGGASSGGSSGGSSGDTGGDTETPVDKYTITYSKIGNGTLETSVITGTKVAEGTDIEFTATPDENYQVKQWKINGNVITQDLEGGIYPITTHNYTLENITTDTTVTVEFEEKEKQLLKYSVIGGHGTLEADFENNTEIYMNTEVTYTAIPDEGYKNAGWITDLTYHAYQEIYVYTNIDVTEDLDIEAMFEPIEENENRHVVTYEIIGNGEVYPTVPNGGTIADGEDADFQIIPAEGNEVKSLKFNNSNDYTTLGDNLVFTTITEDMHVIVEFAEKESFEFTYELIGNGEIQAKKAVYENDYDQMPELIPLISGERLYYGDEVLVSVSPDEGLKIKSWSGVENSNGYEYELYKKIITIKEDTNIVVELEEIGIDEEYYTLTYSSIGNGRVFSSIPSGVQVEKDTEVELMAIIEDEGYRFKHWVVNGEELLDDDITLRITENTTITAEFEEIIPYTVNYSEVSENGYIEAYEISGPYVENGDQVESGTIVRFYADPNPGYRLKEWKLNGEVQQEQGYTLEITINNDTDVTAEFEPIPLLKFTITYNSIGNGTLETSIAAGGEIVEGSDLTFTATPNDGYRVKKWKVNGNIITQDFEGGIYPITTHNYTLENIAEDTTVKVEFEQIPEVPIATQLSVTTEANTDTLIDVLEAAIYTPGYEVTIQLETNPNNGTAVIESNKIKYTPNTDFSGEDFFTYTLTNEAGQSEVSTVNVTVNPLVTYTVTFETNGGSSIDPMVLNEIGTITLPQDPTKEDNEFEGWYADPELTLEFDTSTSIEIDTTLYAKWDVNQYTITYTITGEGTISSSKDTVNHGEDVVIIATFNEDTHKVLRWVVNGSDDVELGPVLTLTNIQNDKVVNVEIQPITRYTINYTSDDNGRIDSQLTNGQEVDSDTMLEFVAVPNEGYKLDKWTINGAPQPETGNLVIYSIEENTTVHATFQHTTHSFSFEVIGGEDGNGKINTHHTQHSDPAVEYGTEIDLGAYPDDGYRVKEWKVNGVITDDTDRLRMFVSEDTVVTLEFELIN